jgi:ferredoxin
MTLTEKLGKGSFADKGPVKIGTAFIDRAKCLPWAFNTPCIVCQENCPVSPKAIYTRIVYTNVVDLPINVKSIDKNTIYLDGGTFSPNSFATGDYYCLISSGSQNIRRKIVSNSSDAIIISGESVPDAVRPDSVQIQIKLQQPYIDPRKCIGCGICQHECPVSGSGAVIVTAFGQTREK